jgi:hypothetical protein
MCGRLLRPLSVINIMLLLLLLQWLQPRLAYKAGKFSDILASKFSLSWCISGSDLNLSCTYINMYVL